MAQIMELPDGSTMEFDDNTSPEDMNRAVSQHLQSPEYLATQGKPQGKPQMQMPARPTSRGRWPDPVPVSPVPEMFTQDPSVPNPGAQMPLSAPPEIKDTYKQPERPFIQWGRDKLGPGPGQSADIRPLFDQAGGTPQDPNKAYTIARPVAETIPDTYASGLGKEITTRIRGAGEGVSSMADLPALGAQYIGNKTARLFGGNELPYVMPVTAAYNAAAPAVPPGYEAANEQGAMYGPAALETLATLGLGAPEAAAGSTGIRGIVRNAMPLAVRAGARSLTDLGAGYGGENFGKGAGYLLDQTNEAITGRPDTQYQDLFGTAGSILGPGGVRGIANTVKSGLLHENSPAVLASVDRANQRLQQLGLPKIPVSLALVGSKGASVFEDTLARGVLTGKPVQEARAGQYAGIENLLRDAAAQRRGFVQEGRITPEGIGADANAMAQKTQDIISGKVDDLQEPFDLGHAPVEPLPFIARMNTIATDPGEDARFQDQAAALRDAYGRNMGVPAAQQGEIPPLAPGGGARIQGPGRKPTYGATKQFRGNLGPQIVEPNRLANEVKNPAYSSLTTVMRNAQDPANFGRFDTAQAETARLYDQQDEIAPLLDKTEKSAFNEILAGENKNSIAQLEPHAEHNPEDLARILADNLELRLRGPQNAGGPPIPQTFKPERLGEWNSMGADTKDLYTGGSLPMEHQIDTAAELASADLRRAGKRSAPGQTGSTIGSTVGTGLSTGLTSAGGFLLGHSPSAAAYGALAGVPLTALGSYGLGKLLTNEDFVRSLVAGRVVSPVREAAAGLGGLGVHTATTNADQRSEQQKAADDAYLEALIQGGGVPPTPGSGLQRP